MKAIHKLYIGIFFIILSGGLGAWLLPRPFGFVVPGIVLIIWDVWFLDFESFRERRRNHD